MAEFSPQSLFIALTTPFDDRGDIDFEAFASHGAFLEAAGVQGIFLAGTTGEFSALTFEEKRALLRFARRTFHAKIVFNVSSTSLREAQTLVKVAEEEGADAITILPPFYTAHAPQAGVTAFLKTLKEGTTLPTILYHFPRHTQNDLTPEMVHDIAPVGVKDSGGVPERIGAYHSYLCGGDSQMVSLYALGARGVVSVQGNYRPKAIVTLFDGLSHGGEQEVAQQREVARISAAFRTEHQIAAIKYAVSLLVPGYPVDVRLPLVPLPKEEQQRIADLVASFSTTLS